MGKKERWYAALCEYYDGERFGLVFVFHLKDPLKAYRLHKAGQLVEARKALEEAAARVYVDDALYWKLKEQFEGKYEGVLEEDPESAAEETGPVSFRAEVPVSSGPGAFRFYASFRWWTLEGSGTACGELALNLEEVSAPAPRRLRTWNATTSVSAGSLP